ncbi:MAG: DUF4097 family beta strand repeat-containing protein [Ilumatobacteraceae bacterium]
MWWIAGVVLFVGALTAGAYQVVTLLAHEERTETLSYPAAGLTTVDVATGNGAVRVTTSATDDVVVRARISEGLRRTGEEQQVVGDTLRLRATCPNFGSDWCAVDYTLEVPRDLALVIRTNDGPIEGSDLRSTTVSADTDNGGVELAFATPPETVTATADHGSVEVVVPDDGTAYRLDVETEYGERIEAAPIDSSSARSITVHTDHGDASVRTR